MDDNPIDSFQGVYEVSALTGVKRRHRSVCFQRVNREQEHLYQFITGPILEVSFQDRISTLF